MADYYFNSLKQRTFMAKLAKNGVPCFDNSGNNYAFLVGFDYGFCTTDHLLTNLNGRVDGDVLGRPQKALLAFTDTEEAEIILAGFALVTSGK
jgi:hypothetical protein